MFLRNQRQNSTILLDGIQMKYHDVAYFPDERMDDPYFALFVKQNSLRVTDGPATVDINGPIVTAGAAETEIPVSEVGDTPPAEATTARKRSAKK